MTDQPQIMGESDAKIFHFLKLIFLLLDMNEYNWVGFVFKKENLSNFSVFNIYKYCFLLSMIIIP
jgi:hypothetical protein